MARQDGLLACLFFCVGRVHAKKNSLIRPREQASLSSVTDDVRRRPGRPLDPPPSVPLSPLPGFPSDAAEVEAENEVCEYLDEVKPAPDKMDMPTSTEESTPRAVGEGMPEPKPTSGDASAAAAAMLGWP